MCKIKFSNKIRLQLFLLRSKVFLRPFNNFYNKFILNLCLAIEPKIPGENLFNLSFGLMGSVNQRCFKKIFWDSQRNTFQWYHVAAIWDKTCKFDTMIICEFSELQGTLAIFFVCKPHLTSPHSDQQLVLGFDAFAVLNPTILHSISQYIA